MTGRVGARIAASGRRTRSSERGFTMVELVMVLVLVAVGVPPLISIGNTCLQKMHQGSYATVGTALAQEKLETILGDKAAPSRGFSYIVTGNYPAEPNVAGFTTYARSVTIDTDSTYNSVTFRCVTVTVTTPDGQACALSTWVLNQ